MPESRALLELTEEAGRGARRIGVPMLSASWIGVILARSERAGTRRGCTSGGHRSIEIKQ
jgi:hypothetical protein